MCLKEKLKSETQDAVRKTVNKFKQNPYYFFTETDIHSYFYYCLYNSTFEVSKNNKRIYLVHREYPTNFRYKKEELGSKETSKTYELETKKGRRGNYDIAVINPEYAENARNIDYIINKNITDVEERYSND